ncbi:hypothetical protein AB0M39_39590 [Streptomyces sp. NPDC051907]|uniref:hypothetical protein n=1 Tax=Streptomyces sp. NPDC051907 TaxID=3155284 RepID=UPI00343A708E
MSRDSADEQLDLLLASAHEQLGTVVDDGLMSSGGPPELHDPDRALGRLLAAVHRQTAAAVGRRLAGGRKRPAYRQLPVPRGSTYDGWRTLAQRPAAVRLKYREDALRISRDYWPADLVRILRDALEHFRGLTADLEAERLSPDACQQLTQVSSRIAAVRALPESVQPPPAVVGYDYLETVVNGLSTCGLRLSAMVESAQQLLESELLPHLLEEDVSCLGAVEVAQDLVDDLDLAQREAAALAAVVNEVDRASTDFCGADLRSADLDGVNLEGVLWDGSTAWPPEWHDRIWRASLAAETGSGVLVVRLESHDSSVHADI